MIAWDYISSRERIRVRVWDDYYCIFLFVPHTDVRETAAK